MGKRTSTCEGEKKETEPVHSTIDRHWGTPRTCAADLEKQSQTTLPVDSQETPRCLLDSPDDEAYVQIEAPRSPSTAVAKSAATAEPAAWDVRVQLSQRSNSSASTGDDSVLGANSQQSPNGHMGDAAVHRDNPFRATLVHTNVLWRRDYDSSMTGHQEKGFPISLFDSSSIIEEPDHLDALGDYARKCYEFDRHQYYIDLFFQMRLFKKKMKRLSNTRPSPRSLTESWNAFIGEYSPSATSWLRRLNIERARYVDHSLVGYKMEVHQRSIEAGFPCGVRRNQDCPFCYKDSKKIPDHIRLEDSYWCRIPSGLRVLMINLDMKCIDEMKEQQEREAEEYDAQNTLSDKYFARDQTLMMQQQVATTHLEIHRLKRTNMSLDQQVHKLTKRYNESEEQHRDDRDSLVQLVFQLSKKVEDLSNRIGSNG